MIIFQKERAIQFMEESKIIHKYRMRKTAWGIAINIYGRVCDYNKFFNNKEFLENVVKICEGISVLFLPDENENVGPHDSYNQMHPDDYHYILEGLIKVSQDIVHFTKYKNTLIIINRLEYNLCDFQEEGIIAGMMEWAARAFGFECPKIDAIYQKDINRYIYKF